MNIDNQESKRHKFANKKVRLKSGVLFALLVTPCFAAPQQSSAPSAGGYSSDFGSDFGVGMTKSNASRTPIVVAGFAGKTLSAAAPWLGIRFADLLSQRLSPVMGRAASTSSVAQFLASRGLRAQDVSYPRNANAAALNFLRRDANWKNRANLLAMGEISISAAAPQATALTRDGTMLTVRLRLVRLRDNAMSPLVVVRAPSREWAQLPSRTALALLDSLRINLTEDERVSLVRDASPLMPNASDARLRAEEQLGTGIAAALDSRVLQSRSNWRAAALRGDAALRALRPLPKNDAATIQDGDAFRDIAASARGWIPYAAQGAGAARARLKSAR